MDINHEEARFDATYDSDKDETSLNDEERDDNPEANGFLFRFRACI